MHLVLLPLSLIVFTVRPVVLALTAYLILYELPIIVATFGEYEFAFAMLAPLIVLALILRTIRPLLLTPPVLFIFTPVTAVHGTICMNVGTLAMCLIVDPFSFVDVTISVIELPIAMGAILLVVTFIARAIGPLLSAETLSQGTDPFTCVDTATWQGHWAALEFGLVVIATAYLLIIDWARCIWRVETIPSLSITR